MMCKYGVERLQLRRPRRIQCKLLGRKTPRILETEPHSRRRRGHLTLEVVDGWEHVGTIDPLSPSIILSSELNKTIYGTLGTHVICRKFHVRVQLQC